MASRVEMFRKEILREGDPLSWHPMNQRMTKDIMDRLRKGHNSKAEKAGLRRLREKRFLEDLPDMQFHRALGHILDGTETPESIRYVLDHISGLEEKVETFFTDKGSEVTVTIVDLPRQNGINSKALGQEEIFNAA